MSGSVFGKFAASQEMEKILSGDHLPFKDVKNGELAIVVLDRGWVFVGFVTHLEDERIRIDCCYNVHKWGAERGLGQIAVEGPTSETILYPAGPVYGKPIFLMGVNEEKWF